MKKNSLKRLDLYNEFMVSLAVQAVTLSCYCTPDLKSLPVRGRILPREGLKLPAVHFYYDGRRYSASVWSIIDGEKRVYSFQK